MERLEDVHMAKEEYYLLKALVLANSDVRLDEAVTPKKFRESILTALTECVTVIRYSHQTESSVVIVNGYLYCFLYNKGLL